MSANFKSSQDGTKAIIGVNGGEQLTVSQDGTVKASSISFDAADSLKLDTKPYSNISIGYGSLAHNLSTENIAIGTNALHNYTAGGRYETGTVKSIIAIGTNALSSFSLNDAGAGGVVIGADSGSKLVGDSAPWSLLNTAFGNVLVGPKTLEQTLSATYNVYIGSLAGRFVETAASTVAIGEAALACRGNYFEVSPGLSAYSVPSGSFHWASTCIGSAAMQDVSASSYDTVVGHYCFGNTKDSARNTAVGTAVAQLSHPNVRFGGNVFIGDNAAQAIGGAYNSSTYTPNISGCTIVGRLAGQQSRETITAVGYLAGRKNTTGVKNTAMGFVALSSNTTGIQNTALGEGCLLSNTLGSYNTAVGTRALSYNTTGTGNTAVGNGAAFKNRTSWNTAVGIDSLFNTETGYSNTALGAHSLYYNVSGNNNTAVGRNSLYQNTGNANSAFGTLALQDNTTGDRNTATGSFSLQYNRTGSDNVAYGNISLYRNDTGDHNTAVGGAALYSNVTGSHSTAIGYASLSANTGEHNVGVGAHAQSSSPTVSNEVNIYNGSVTARFQGAASAWSFVSDERDKKNISDLDLGLAFVEELKPRKFEWDVRGSEVDKGKPAVGFIAQELLQTVEANSASHANLVDTNDSDRYTVAQTNLIPVLVNAIKELSAELKSVKAELANLK